MRLTVGPEPRWRLSVHFFGPNDQREKRTRGLHVKLRRGRVFRHFVIKLRHGSSFGRKGMRRELWIGWFESRDGVRGLMNGWRASYALDRMRDFTPTENTDFPIAPSKPRARQAEFEVR